MLTFIIVLIIIASILLTLVVLIQNPKGGISSNFISPTQVMGVKKSTDLVEKATWILAATLIVLSLLSNFFIPTGSESGDSANQSRLKDEIENVTVPVTPQPNQQQQGQ